MVYINQELIARGDFLKIQATPNDVQELSGILNKDEPDWLPVPFKSIKIDTSANRGDEGVKVKSIDRVGFQNSKKGVSVVIPPNELHIVHNNVLKISNLKNEINMYSDIFNKTSELMLNYLEKKKIEIKINRVSYVTKLIFSEKETNNFKEIYSSRMGNFDRSVEDGLEYSKWSNRRVLKLTLPKLESKELNFSHTLARSSGSYNFHNKIIPYDSFDVLFDYNTPGNNQEMKYHQKDIQIILQYVKENLEIEKWCGDIVKL